MPTKKVRYQTQKDSSKATDEKILNALNNEPRSFGEIRKLTGLSQSIATPHCKKLIEQGKIGKHYNRSTDRVEYFMNDAASYDYLTAYRNELLLHVEQLGGTIEPIAKRLREKGRFKDTRGAITP